MDALDIPAYMAAMGAGAAVHGKTPVLSIEREASGRFRVTTLRGVVSAGRVILGTNGYTGKGLDWFRRRLIPVNAGVVVSEAIGAERVKVIHVNDSQKPFGKRVDRHAHLGQGEIGPVAFACLCQDARWTETPLIVETPEAETHHQVNVARLWAWSRGENPVMD